MISNIVMGFPARLIVVCTNKHLEAIEKREE